MNEHGELVISWEKNIFIVRANYAFNVKGAISGVDKMKTSILKKKLMVWHRLLIWDEQCLSSQETLNIFKDAHKWFLENGCNKTAIVVSNSYQKSIVDKMFNSNREKVFRIETEAKEWLYKVE